MSGKEEVKEARPRSGSGFDLRQAGVLADRYLETILADWIGTGLLLVQAPILALLAVLVWGNVEQATKTLYFVVVLSGLWIGCMDACREIVKERALFLRERMVNLQVGAYLLSKFRVLVLLNLVQVAAYVGIVEYWLDTRVGLVGMFLAMFLTTVAGTALGLLISSVVRRSDWAVGLVPLVIIPQILFSEFAIRKEDFAGASEVIYWLMPSRWGYDALVALAETEVKWGDVVLNLLPLPLFAVVFLAACWPLLRFQRY